MKNDRTPFLPLMRRDELVIKDADGEVLIYDCLRDEAHCLNVSAADIWRRCDGRNTPEEIANQLRSQQNQKSLNTKRQTIELVWLLLQEFSRRHLLDETSTVSTLPRASMTARISRRTAIKRLGVTAIAIPTVMSITVPTAKAATSCKSHCMPCSTGECCSGVCSNDNSTTGCSGSGFKCL